MQPLKSELNWPLGVKRPLDFTRARPGSKLGNGLRWQVPFHLLEAFFYYTEGRMVVDLAFQDSRRWDHTHHITALGVGRRGGGYHFMHDRSRMTVDQDSRRWAHAYNL